MIMDKELRFVPLEIRSDGEEKRVSGLGIVYDQWEEILPGYKERILKNAVKLNKEVKSFINHDPNQVLSTTKSNPALELKDGYKGLKYISPIPPTSYGKDLEVNLERGNIKGSSFAFSVPKDGAKTWEEDGVYYREINKLLMYEIGPVTDPAYLKTKAGLRTAENLYNEMVEEKRKKCEEEKRQRKRKRDVDIELLEIE